MAEVLLPRSLAALFPGTPRRLRASGATVADVIDDLDAQVPGLRNRIVDAGPAIRTHINVFVAGERAGLATPVPSGATVHVIPAVSGGEERFVPVPAAEARPAPLDGDVAPTTASGERRPIDDPRALQILTTEHWSLLTARSLVYNETFARGGMFLALLSATLVALGLVSTATGFSDGFLAVTAVVLALDLFVGLATLGRIMAASDEDIRSLQAMNRVRHAYFEIVPGIQRYFTTSGYDDFRSVLMHYGPEPDPSVLRAVLHGLTTMPGMIGVICSAIAGVLLGVLAVLVTHDAALAAILGVVGFVVVYLVTTLAIMRAVRGFQIAWTSVFPRPQDGPPQTR
jgi:molybdopterin synthase sulfur carrier subunit